MCGISKVFRSGLIAVISALIACIASAVQAVSPPVRAGASQAQEAAAAPAQAAPMPDLSSKERIEEGRKQFAQNCVYCHGNGGSGGKAGPLAGRDDLTADYVFTTISEGKRVGAMVMPTWKASMDESTRWALTAYLMSLQQKK